MFSTYSCDPRRLIRRSSSINSVGPLSGLGESSFSKSSCRGMRNEERREPDPFSASDGFCCWFDGMIWIPPNTSYADFLQKLGDKKRHKGWSIRQSFFGFNTFSEFDPATLNLVPPRHSCWRWRSSGCRRRSYAGARLWLIVVSIRRVSAAQSRCDSAYCFWYSPTRFRCCCWWFSAFRLWASRAPWWSLARRRSVDAARDFAAERGRSDWRLRWCSAWRPSADVVKLLKQARLSLSRWSLAGCISATTFSCDTRYSAKCSTWSAQAWEKKSFECAQNEFSPDPRNCPSCCSWRSLRRLCIYIRSMFCWSHQA